MANIISHDKRIQITITIPMSKRKLINKLARKERMSISRFIESGIDKKIEEYLSNQPIKVS